MKSQELTDQANKICQDIKSSGAKIVAAKAIKKGAIKEVIDRSQLALAMEEARLLLQWKKQGQ